jgi:hypothetical protein
MIELYLDLSSSGSATPGATAARIVGCFDSDVIADFWIR